MEPIFDPLSSSLNRTDALAAEPPRVSALVAEARAVSLRALLAEWDADADARHQAKKTGNPLGPLTALPGLDRALGGALLPGLHILHGTPGAGKTAFVLQVAASCSCPCLFVTAEMSALELLRRITARVTETYLDKFKSGELPLQKSSTLVRRAVAAASDLVLLDATTAPASPERVQQQADLARDDAPHILIVIDSLHSWAEGAFPGVPEYDALNDALRCLRTIAANLACPIIAVAERNRAAMDKGGQSAGAGSRKIEYGAESVIELNRDEKALRDAGGEVLVHYKLSKNRNGAATDQKPLLFHGGFQRFREESK